jgi:hypothetical protein
MRLLCRRIFIGAPRWTYRLAGSAGGSLSTRLVLLMGAISALAGLIWMLVMAVASDRGGTDAFWDGVIVGLFLCVIWLTYSAIVVLVSWVVERRRTKSS